MRIALYLVAGFLGVAAISVVAGVGKPRKPTTGGQAAAVVLVYAAIITVLMLAAQTVA